MHKVLIDTDKWRRRPKLQKSVKIKKNKKTLWNHQIGEEEKRQEDEGNEEKRPGFFQ